MPIPTSTLAWAVPDASTDAAAIAQTAKIFCMMLFRRMLPIP
ncbi:hypothetical protein D8I24_0463 [Cupriavidus necator H850]|nr:hypothetical protein D8I24_0463 [Cupriavidus necator H850]